MPPQADTKTEEKPQELTAAEAAKLVFRVVPKLDSEGRPTTRTEKKPITADEVFAWNDYGDHVVVVTKDGQKFSVDKAGK